MNKTNSVKFKLCNQVLEKQLSFSKIGSPGGVSRSYTYDSFGRVDEISETIEAGQTNKVKFAYDNLGRVSSKTYTNSNNVSYVESNVYNSYGFLDQVKFNNTLAYKVTAMDTRGNITTAHIGGANAFWGYNPQGVLTSISATNVQSFSYNFDLETGNLLSRTDRLRSKSETFLYDDLDRLTSASRTGATLSMGYDDKGNLTSKSDAGTLVYDNGSPYQLAHVTPYSANFPLGEQVATYTSHGQVNTITDGAYGATFKYNSDMQRVKMASTQNGSATKTKYYFGSSYEKEVSGTTTTEYIWIGGDAYTAVAVAKIVNNGTPQIWGIYRDHLGSITHVKNGTTVQEYSYDAWGRRRTPAYWDYNLSGQPALIADRGFTGHEHLTEFGLINMNGRLYDPLVGRFLSPDNYVQDASNTQNFNRYGYCLNNPLKYTDPDGEFIVEAMLLGAFVNTFFQLGAGNIKNPGDFFTAIGVGALSGAAGFGAGQFVAGIVGTVGFTGGALTGMAGGFAGGFVGGAGNAWNNGSSFKQGIGQGLIGGGIGAATGGLIGGISGGISATRHGGDFWSGEGAIFESPALEGLTPENVKIGKGMEYTTKYANGVADDTYGKLSYIQRIATNEVPVGEGYTLNNGCIINKEGRMANGLTRYLGKGNSEVYLGKSAFTSVNQLKLTIGHEYIHATQNYMAFKKLITNVNATYKGYPMAEIAAHNWESTMGVSNGFGAWTGKLGAWAWNRQPYYNWLLNANF